jgi:lycopene cyclase domain-containing protein
MTKYTYLMVNFFTIIVPFLFSFHPRLMFWKNVKAFVPACVITSLAFLVWDVIFTKIGVWGFNERYVVGWFIYGLPIEEILFFFCIPYACVFSYHCFGVLVKRFDWVNTKLWSPMLIVVGLVFTILFYDRWYPSVNFAVFTVLIVYLAFIKKVVWLAQFYFTYLIMILPFLIVNGVLTGTGLAEPIVWYNNAETIGFRILTIPFEDVFYGMSLIGLNILIYEGLLKRRANLLG